MVSYSAFSDAPNALLNSVLVESSFEFINDLDIIINNTGKIENVFKQIALSLGFNADDYESTEEVYRVKDKIFNKTEYTYTEPVQTERIVYVNPRHHEGVLTKIIFAHEEENYPNFPEIEKYISPGYVRSGNISDNLAKGVKLIPR